MISKTTTFFTVKQANELADKLNQDDDDWTYVPVHPAQGYSVIEIYDEDKEFVSRL